MRRLLATSAAILLWAGTADAQEPPPAGVPARVDGVSARARSPALVAALGVAVAAAGGTAAWLTRWDDHAAIGYVPLLVGGGGLALGGGLAALLDLIAPPAAGTAAGDRRRVVLAVGHRFLRQAPLPGGHGAGLRLGVRAGVAAGDLAAEQGDGWTHARLDVVVPLWRPGRVAFGAGVLAERTHLASSGVTSVPAGGFVELAARSGRSTGRLRLGGGLEHVAWPAASAEWHGLTIASAALEIDLPRVTVTVDYDHRKDRAPGGLYLGRGPGFFGSAGLAGRVRLGHDLSACLEARLGTGVSTWTALERSW